MAAAGGKPECPTDPAAPPHRSLQASIAACRAAVWYSLVDGTAPDWLVKQVVGGGRESRAAAAECPAHARASAATITVSRIIFTARIRR